jgi:hypothetical protein
MIYQVIKNKCKFDRMLKGTRYRNRSLAQAVMDAFYGRKFGRRNKRVPVQE